MDKNTTHLAGEFLVAGELSRRGLKVSLTFGNAKSVDIFAEHERGRVYKIDAKAIRSRANWLIDKQKIQKDMMYVLVYLGNLFAIKFNKPIEYYILSGHEIISDNLLSEWNGGRSGIKYSAVKGTAYENRWGAFNGVAWWPTENMGTSMFFRPRIPRHRENSSCEDAMQTEVK